MTCNTFSPVWDDKMMINGHKDDDEDDEDDDDHDDDDGDDDDDDDDGDDDETATPAIASVTRFNSRRCFRNLV